VTVSADARPGPSHSRAWQNACIFARSFPNDVAARTCPVVVPLSVSLDTETGGSLDQWDGDNGAYEHQRQPRQGGEMGARRWTFL
jgi:hypothetical protein